MTKDEDKRRQRRLMLAEKWAKEVATWPSWKLRQCYAQPDAVRAAEERERAAQLVPA